MDSRINFLQKFKTEKQSFIFDKAIFAWTEKIFTNITVWDYLDIFSLSALCFLANFLMDISMLRIFLVFFAVANFYWRFGSRWSFTLAIFCLLCSMLMMKSFEMDLIYRGEIWSNRLSACAFYFLGIGTTAQLLEVKRRVVLVKKTLQKIKKPERSPVVKLRSDAISAVYNPPHIVNLKGSII